MPPEERPAVTREAVTRTLVVREPNGLHMRPAETVARTAQQFEATVHLRSGDYRVDAKSIFDLITLAAECGAELELVAEGADAAAAAEAIATLFENRFLTEKRPQDESRAG
jgi:phosphotransferase system HPr (HPr) family protein